MLTIQERNKALMREYVKVVQNEQDLEACNRFLSPDFVNPHIFEILATGEGAKEDFKDHVEGTKFTHRMLFKAFPDIRVTILDMAADGDKVWTYKLFEGTHLGPWMDIPATGKKVSFQVIDIMSFRDGMIMDYQMVSGFVSMVDGLRQPK